MAHSHHCSSTQFWHFLARAIRQSYQTLSKKSEGIETEKEDVKLALFADNMILYAGESKNSGKETIGTQKENLVKLQYINQQ